jgi:hypothetical protein
VEALAVHGLGLPVTRVTPARGVTAIPQARGLAGGQKLLQDRGLPSEALVRVAPE